MALYWQQVMYKYTIWSFQAAYKWMTVWDLVDCHSSYAAPLVTLLLLNMFFGGSSKSAEEENEEVMAKLKNLETADEYKKEALDSTTFVYKLGLSKMHPALLMNGLVYGPNQVYQVFYFV